MVQQENKLVTPRGTFKIVAEFTSEKEANKAGFGIYFTHYDEADNQIDIYTHHIDEYHVKFAIVKRNWIVRSY